VLDETWPTHLRHPAQGASRTGRWQVRSTRRPAGRSRHIWSCRFISAETAFRGTLFNLCPCRSVSPCQRVVCCFRISLLGAQAVPCCGCLAGQLSTPAQYAQYASRFVSLTLTLSLKRKQGWTRASSLLIPSNPTLTISSLAPCMVALRAVCVACLLRARPTLAARRVLPKALPVSCYVPRRHRPSLPTPGQGEIVGRRLLFRYRILPETGQVYTRRRSLNSSLKHVSNKDLSNRDTGPDHLCVCFCPILVVFYDPVNRRCPVELSICFPGKMGRFFQAKTTPSMISVARERSRQRL